MWKTIGSGTRRVTGAAVLGWMLASPATGVAQETRLGSVDPFLLDRAEEIALARSAAPFELGRDADVWVLTRTGYVRVEEGTNGFACFVGRGWSGPILIGRGEQRRLHPDVFNTRLRAPHCFNPLAAETILPWQLARTEALLEGVPAERVDEAMARRLRDGTLAAPRPGAMAYMTSSGQDLGQGLGNWRPHVMIYLPELENASWGIPGFTNDHPFVAEPGSPWAVAVVPMRVFSDGTAAREIPGREGAR